MNFDVEVWGIITRSSCKTDEEMFRIVEDKVSSSPLPFITSGQFSAFYSRVESCQFPRMVWRALNNVLISYFSAYSNHLFYCYCTWYQASTLSAWSHSYPPWYRCPRLSSLVGQQSIYLSRGSTYQKAQATSSYCSVTRIWTGGRGFAPHIMWVETVPCPENISLLYCRLHSECRLHHLYEANHEYLVDKCVDKRIYELVCLAANATTTEASRLGTLV